MFTQVTKDGRSDGKEDMLGCIFFGWVGRKFCVRFPMDSFLPKDHEGLSSTGLRHERV